MCHQKGVPQGRGRDTSRRAQGSPPSTTANLHDRRRCRGRVSRARIVDETSSLPSSSMRRGAQVASPGHHAPWVFLMGVWVYGVEDGGSMKNTAPCGQPSFLAPSAAVLVRTSGPYPTGRRGLAADLYTASHRALTVRERRGRTSLYRPRRLRNKWLLEAFFFIHEQLTCASSASTSRALVESPLATAVGVNLRTGEARSASRSAPNPHQTTSHPCVTLQRCTDRPPPRGGGGKPPHVNTVQPDPTRETSFASRDGPGCPSTKAPQARQQPGDHAISPSGDLTSELYVPPPPAPRRIDSSCGRRRGYEPDPRPGSVRRQRHQPDNLSLARGRRGHPRARGPMSQPSIQRARRARCQGPSSAASPGLGSARPYAHAPPTAPISCGRPDALRLGIDSTRRVGSLVGVSGRGGGGTVKRGQGRG